MTTDFGSAKGTIELDGSPAISEAQRVEGALSGVGSRISGSLGKVGLAVAGAVAAGAAVVAGGVAAVGSSVVSLSNDTRNAALDMEAQFGMTAGEAERTANLARDAWSNNWGESVGDVSTVMGTVIQQLEEFGVTSDKQITNATTAAIGLRDTFGTDTSESIDAARALMERFGISSDEAFNLITTGMQSGLSANGDFLESVTEYAPVFEAAGFTAAEMYSIMESGAASGVLGTDKIADAVKEMGVKLAEGGDDTKDAFDEMGMSYDDMAETVSDGEATWADYFDEIVGGINGIEDPLERQKAQVAIFGTMAEDLGANFTEGLSTAGNALSDFEGATDSLSRKYDSFGAMWEGIKRRVVDALAPIGDMVLNLANEHMPAIEDAVGRFTERIGEVIELLAEGDLEGALSALFGEEVAGKIISVATAVGDFASWMQTLIQEHIRPFLQEHGPVLQQVLGAIAVAFGAFTIISTVVGWISGLVAAVGGIITAFTGAGTIIGGIVAILGGPLTLIIAAVAGAIALLTVAWNNNWGDIQGKTRAVVDWIQEKVDQFLTTIRQWWDEHGERVIEIVTFLWDSVKKLFETAKKNLSDIVQALKALLTGDFEEAEEKLKEIWQRTWETIKEIATRLWSEYLQPAFAALWTSLSGWWEDLKTDVAAWAENFMTAAKDKFTEFWETHVKQPFEELWTAISDWWTGLDDDVKGLAQDWMTWIKEALGDFWESYVKQPFEDLWTGIRTWVDEKVDSFKQIGRDIMQGLKDGLIEKKQEVIAWIESLVGDIIETVKRLLGIASPSTVFSEIGVHIMAGLINGINDMVNELEDAASATVAVLESIFSSADITTGISSEFLSYLDAQLQDEVIRPMEEATEYIDDLWGRLFDRLPAHLQGMFPGSVAELTGSEIEQLIRDLRARWYTMDDQSNRELDMILRTLGVRNQYEAEYLDYKEREAELARQQAELGFLQAQLDLLQLVQDAGLDASILEGLELGLGASIEGVLQAMSDVTQALIQQAEDALGIASPSRVFAGIGEMIGRGLELGLAQTLRPDLISGRLEDMIRPLPGIVRESVDNSRHMAVYGGIFVNGQGTESDALGKIQRMLSYG